MDLTYYAHAQSREEQLFGRERNMKDEIVDKRLKILRAYKNKSNLSKSRSESQLAFIKKETEILPLSPIKVPRMKKFEWSASPCIAGSSSKPRPIPVESQWWKKDATQPGCAMNPTQSRLSLKENFTGSVKHNFRHHRIKARSRGVVFNDDYDKSMEGLFPDEAFKFLETSNTWKSDHHMKVQRQGDMLSEATFRASLRDFH
jgi:hypothetical protein